MKTYLPVLGLLLGAPLALAQNYRSTVSGSTATASDSAAAAASATPKDKDRDASGEFTLGSQAVGNVNELVKKVQEQNAQATKRILEIDAYVNPILGETANRLFGVHSNEYLFLMKQSLARRAPAVFGKQRGADNQTPDGILEYFDKAYAAIQRKEFWFGREESLVPLDNQLYQMMKTDVLAAIAKRSDGEKITAMLTERETLLSRLNTNLPLFNYLQERREWWKTYPDYMKTVEQESQGIEAEIRPGGGGGPGGGRGGGWGGGGGWGRGR
ncbi:MAG: hypothetical protein LBK60_08520 [Verrucomicrobiales bacterium]|jgi:hypothetical protein|nr:hypothetical protein [Verrucomicrobiales bacterium]